MFKKGKWPGLLDTGECARLDRPHSCLEKQVSCLCDLTPGQLIHPQAVSAQPGLDDSPSQTWSLMHQQAGQVRGGAGTEVPKGPLVAHTALWAPLAICGAQIPWF